MLPESLLKFSQVQGIIAPHYLDERDHSWIRLLIHEYKRFIGSPRSKLVRHLRTRLPFFLPEGKRQLAFYVLNREFHSEVISKVPPPKLRKALFEAAANGFPCRKSLLASVAEAHAMSSDELEASLFSDLPSEKRITDSSANLSPGEVALKANSLLVQGFLARAVSTRIELLGNARAVIRQAKLRGLICQVRDEEAEFRKEDGREGQEGKMTLDISGPFTLFRRTLLYGKSLGELVPPLVWCHQFQLTAKCIVDKTEHLLVVASGDPIFPSQSPPTFDSKVEEMFAKRFQKIAHDWDLIREPSALKACDTLIFPDFLLRSRENPLTIWLLEIIGFWTSDYLQKKIQQLKAAKIDNLILCINEDLNCTDEDFPEVAHIVWYRKNIDPKEVLKVIEAASS